MNTPIPAALLVLLCSPLRANHAVQEPGRKQVLLWALGSYAQGSSRKPMARILEPELLSSCRVPNSSESWSLGSFALTRTVQPRGDQSRSTVPLQWLEVMPVAVMPCLFSLVKL